MLNKRQIVLQAVGFALFCVVGVLLFTVAGNVRARYGVQDDKSAVKTEDFVSRFGIGKQYKFKTTQSTTTYTYWSNITYVNSNLDCSTYTPNMFILQVANSLSMDPNSIRVVDMACDNTMTIFFQCASTTLSTSISNYIDAGNAQCTIVKGSIEKTGNTLNTLLAITRPPQWSDDGTSNNAIYALYVLILLPIFCCVGCIVWYKVKQSQADSQYLQDTATFSKVAARQPQQPYDPTAPLYQPPVAQPAPPMPVMQPVPQYAPQYATPAPQYSAPYTSPAQYAAPPQYAAPAAPQYGYYPQ